MTTTTPTKEKPKDRRGVVTLVVLTLIAGVVGWLLSGGLPTSGDARSAPLMPPVVPSAVISWQKLDGFQLPVSSVDGPRCITSTHAGCFSHSESGAAFAAAHLLARTCAFVGPNVFSTTIATQVVGTNADALRRVTEQAYADAAASSGVTPPEPLPTNPGWVAGYRVEPSASPDSYVVRLLVRETSTDGDVMAQFRVQVEWHEDDWRVVAPDWGDWSTAAVAVAQARPGEWLSFDDLARR